MKKRRADPALRAAASADRALVNASQLCQDRGHVKLANALRAAHLAVRLFLDIEPSPEESSDLHHERDAAESDSVQRFLKKGFYWSLAPRRRGRSYDHTFCGPHDIKGAQCPNCHKPLLLFASLDAGDPRLSLQEAPFRHLPLLFCWTCNYAQGVSAYRILASDAIEIVQVEPGGVEEDFPYRDYPEFFPRAHIRLRPMPGKELDENAQCNSGRKDPGERESPHVTPPHQIGGEPYFLQGVPAVRCPRCCEQMKYLATVGDATADQERGFTGNESTAVHFMVCPGDWVIASYQECD